MISKQITMIDYGASNIRSAQKAFEHIGADVILTEDPDVVRKADKLVLPGVGAFGSGMTGLHERNLPEAIRESAQRGIPFLGICVGMQLMFDIGTEMGTHQGLGIMTGKVVRFPENLTNEKRQSKNDSLLSSSFSLQPLKVPHMGWNQLEPAWESPLIHGINKGDYAYFVHSYYCDPSEATAVLAWTDYGMPFAAIVAKENVYGLQFHPEKSQSVGLHILENFVEKI